MSFLSFAISRCNQLQMGGFEINPVRLHINCISLFCFVLLLKILFFRSIFNITEKLRGNRFSIFSLPYYHLPLEWFTHYN